MTTVESGFAAQLEQAIGAVDGVERVYDANIAAQIVGVAADSLPLLARRSRVRVEDGVVFASVGLEGSTPAPVVARAVHDAVIAAAAAAGVAVERVEVRIVRIGERSR